MPRQLPLQSHSVVAGVNSDNTQDHPGSPSIPEDESAQDTKTRPKKRAKKSTDKGASSSKRNGNPGGRKVIGRLSALLDISLDIFYEVLGHLLPTDLVSLSRVSKSFRNVLLSRSSLFAWKASFGNVPGLPACPDDVPLPVWANLVWGGVYCHCCGNKRVMKIDFLLRRRVCSGCLKQNICDWSGGIFALAPDIPSSLCDYIPYTLEVTKEYSHRIWWSEDILALEADFQTVQKTTKQDDRQAALAEFKQTKLSELQAREDVARSWSDWISRNAAEKANKRDAKKAARRAEVLRRCIVLGYEEADCQDALRHHSVNTEANLTEKGWGTILPQILPFIEAANIARLYREQERREEIRLRAVYAAYYDIVRSLSPSALELSCLLGEEDFRSLPEIHALMVDDTEDREERIAQIKTVSTSLIPKLSALARQRKVSIFALLQDTSEPASHPAPSAVSGSLGQFQLATSIFFCGASEPPSSASPLHGLHAFGHTCKSCKLDSDSTTNELSFDVILPRFSEKGKDVVVAILNRLGLDEKSTTSIDMERLDKRFVCMDCPIKHEGEEWGKLGTLGRKAMTWWSLLDHTLKTNSKTPDSHVGSSFYVLTDAEAASIKSRERSGTLFRIHECFLRFGCYHCDLHYREATLPPNSFGKGLGGPHSSEAYLRRDAMIVHIKTAHAIHDPQMHRDFFPAPRSRYPHPHEVWFQMKVK